MFLSAATRILMQTANTGVRLLRNEGMPYLASCMCVCVCALVCGRIHVRGRVEVLVAGIRRVEPGAGVATTRRHPRRGQKAIDDTLIFIRTRPGRPSKVLARQPRYTRSFPLFARSSLRFTSNRKERLPFTGSLCLIESHEPRPVPRSTSTR